MLKKFLIACFALLLLPAAVQADDSKNELAPYLTGAVPVKNGIVVFEKTYKVPGKTRAEIFEKLQAYVQNDIVKGANSLEQSRILVQDSTSGELAASVEEWLYFKRKAWVTDAARFFYQLNFRIDNDSFAVEMIRLRYLYEEDRSGSSAPYPAEEWITDSEALKKNGTALTKIGGKFRRFTIDRKNQIFDEAAKAAGAVRKVKRVIIEEVVE